MIYYGNQFLYTPDNTLPEGFLALSNQPEKLISIEKELTMTIEEIADEIVWYKVFF